MTNPLHICGLLPPPTNLNILTLLLCVQVVGILYTIFTPLPLGNGGLRLTTTMLSHTCTTQGEANATYSVHACLPGKSSTMFFALHTPGVMCGVTERATHLCVVCVCQ